MSKKFAIIGAGPVGLAAAAHALERDLDPSCWRPGTGLVTRCANGPMSACSRPGPTISTTHPNACSRDGLEFAEPDHYPTGAELVAQYLEPLATRTKLGEHIQTNRALSRSHGWFRQGQDGGREAGPIRNSLSERQRALRHCRWMLSWIPPGLGRHRIPLASTGLTAIGEPSTRIASPTGCRTCWVATDLATRARRSQCGRRPLGHRTPLVRRLVESLGGQIAVESRLGHGATLRFTLPVAVAEAIPHPVEVG